MAKGRKLAHRFLKSPSFKTIATDLDAWEFVDEFKLEIDENPKRWGAIPGGDGIRKGRMRLHNRGKRDGARVFYSHVQSLRLILLLYILDKGDDSDLPKEDLDALISLRDSLLSAQAKGKHHG